eukprot:SAG31_NODE_6457_length_2002_cov_0.821130_3_plen_103_part_00
MRNLALRRPEFKTGAPELSETIGELVSQNFSPGQRTAHVWSEATQRLGERQQYLAATAKASTGSVKRTRPTNCAQKRGRFQSDAIVPIVYSWVSAHLIVVVD